MHAPDLFSVFMFKQYLDGLCTSKFNLIRVWDHGLWIIKEPVMPLRYIRQHNYPRLPLGTLFIQTRGFNHTNFLNVKIVWCILFCMLFYMLFHCSQVTNASLSYIVCVVDVSWNILTNKWVCSQVVMTLAIIYLSHYVLSNLVRYLLSTIDSYMYADFALDHGLFVFMGWDIWCKSSQTLYVFCLCVFKILYT